MAEKITNPLSEVFGFPIINDSVKAKRYRNKKLCPFNNKVPNCTKDKANDPLGVCSVFHTSKPVITCPIRFREDWLIIENAAQFFFGEKTKWTSLSETKLLDKNGQSAGNIDFVLVSYDNKGRLTDFASLEVQGVYISGNLRNPFDAYLEKPFLIEELKNLYLVGAGTHPGAGLPGVLSSARVLDTVVPHADTFNNSTSSRFGAADASLAGSAPGSAPV